MVEIFNITSYTESSCSESEEEIGIELGTNLRKKDNIRYLRGVPPPIPENDVWSFLQRDGPQTESDIRNPSLAIITSRVIEIEDRIGRPLFYQSAGTKHWHEWSVSSERDQSGERVVYWELDEEVITTMSRELFFLLRPDVALEVRRSHPREWRGLMARLVENQRYEVYATIIGSYYGFLDLLPWKDTKEVGRTIGKSLPVDLGGQSLCRVFQDRTGDLHVSDSNKALKDPTIGTAAPVNDRFGVPGAFRPDDWCPPLGEVDEITWDSRFMKHLQLFGPVTRDKISGLRRYGPILRPDLTIEIRGIRGLGKVSTVKCATDAMQREFCDYWAAFNTPMEEFQQVRGIHAFRMMLGKEYYAVEWNVRPRTSFTTILVKEMLRLEEAWRDGALDKARGQGEGDEENNNWQRKVDSLWLTIGRHWWINDARRVMSWEPRRSFTLNGMETDLRGKLPVHERPIYMPTVSWLVAESPLKIIQRVRPGTTSIK